MKKATVEAGQRALEVAGLKELAADPSKLPSNADGFDTQHKIWCKRIQASFGLAEDEFSYGRAAKLVNVYLKTLFLNDFGATSEPSGLAKGRAEDANHIHPPIDRLLLDDLAKASKENAEFWRKYRDKGWTHFGECDYLDVIGMVRKETNGKLWRIEAHWKPRTSRP